MNSTLQLPTGTWTLDTSATTVIVSAKHLLAFTVPATLSVASGAIEIADDHVVSVDIVVDAASYASKNAKRNEHIIGPDFLDAKGHPTIRFEATTVQPTATGYAASGSVTIKARTSPVAVTISNVAIDGDTAKFTASADVDRNDLGVDKMPSLIVGAQLDLTVAATATRAA